MATMTPPQSGVKIRAYRHGFGDCFLLAFPTADDDVAYYLLIDCGLFWQYKRSDGASIAGQLQAVAEDLAEATDGDIDALVITHEHYDHLAGFHQAESLRVLSEEINFRELWLPWTEDPSHELASELRVEAGLEVQALRKELAIVAHRLGLTSLSAHDQEPDDPDALQFLSFADELLAFSKSTGRALQSVRDLFPAEDGAAWPPDNVQFFSPGDLYLPMEGANGPRVWALGPPEDRAAIRVNERTGEHFDLRDWPPALAAAEEGAREDSAAPQEPQSTSQMAIRGRLDAQQDRSRPFGREVGQPLEQALEQPFFHRHYGFGDELPPPAGTAEGERTSARTPPPPGPAWRRIDDTWLGELDELALQYDNFVNNTSLVLAISPPHSDRVLLFVGDAQAGNWLSWADQEVACDDGSGGVISSHELLARTVLYKVGHHGSHNATLRKGVDKMTSEDLVAIVPTDEEWAWHKKRSGDGGWRMPHLPIYEALLAQCRGRVLQTDSGLPTAKPRMAPRIKDGKVPYDEAKWQELQSTIEQHRGAIEEWAASIRTEDLYFEFEIGE